MPPLPPQSRSPSSLPMSTLAGKYGTDLASRTLPISQVRVWSFHLPLHRFLASCLRHTSFIKIRTDSFWFMEEKWAQYAGSGIRDADLLLLQFSILGHSFLHPEVDPEQISDESSNCNSLQINNLMNHQT